MQCFFFPFDSLTGRNGENQDPYLVKLGKSYFNRKTLLFFNRKTGKRFLKLFTLLFIKKKHSFPFFFRMPGRNRPLKPGSRRWRQAAKEGGQRGIRSFFSAQKPQPPSNRAPSHIYIIFRFFHLITIFFDFVVSVCLDAYLPYFLSGYWTGRLSGPQNIGEKNTGFSCST